MPSAPSRYDKSIYANSNPGYALEAKLLRRLAQLVREWEVDELITACALPVSRKQAEDWIDYKADDMLRRFPTEEQQELFRRLETKQDVPLIIREVFLLSKTVKEREWKPSGCRFDDTKLLEGAGLGGRRYQKRPAVVKTPVIYPDPYRETLYGPTCLIPIPLCEVLAQLGATDCEEVLSTLAAHGLTIQRRRVGSSARLGQIELFAEAA